MPVKQGTHYALLDEVQLQKIEAMTDLILKDIGVTLKGDPLSLAILELAGAIVEGENVRIGRASLMAIIQASAPKSFSWKSLESTVQLGTDETYFAPMFGAPNIRRHDNSYTQSQFSDYQTLVKHCEDSPIMASSGYLLCIAHDIPEKVRHIAMLRAHLELSTKPVMGTVLSEIALQEVAIEANATEFHPGECKLLHMINSTPPLTFQSNPLQCLRLASQLGQGCLVTSYMMMGATSPVTFFASLAQGLAEVLIGAALTQLYQPGVAVAAGLFATPFSMRKMLPAFGTMESHVAMLAGIQLIKRLGIPCRGDGLITSAKTHDSQAEFEGNNMLSASLLAGADIILHSAGWLENGRCVDIKKMEFDLQYIEGIQQKVNLDHHFLLP